MAEVRDAASVRGSAVNINTVKYTISGQIIDDENNLAGDYTGTNALSAPEVLDTLTEAQQTKFWVDNREWIMLRKAGIPE